MKCLPGRTCRGLFYLVSLGGVGRGLFLTSLLFQRCQRVLRACQTHFQNGCQAVRWLPRSALTEQVQNGDQPRGVCRPGSPRATPHPTPTTQPPPEKEGGGEDPEDARLGTNALARVAVVSSRDSSSHRVLLVSHAWQKAVQGNT